MKKLYTDYLNTFKGLSKEVWWLALITLINRAGMQLVSSLGFESTWNIVFGVAILCIVFLLILKLMLKKEKSRV